MVHCFIGRHGGKDLHFIWDSESGSLHNADETAFLLAKERCGELTPEEAEACGRIGAQARAAGMAELDALAAEGTLGAAAPPYPERKSTAEVKALCLHICHDCNMRCRYCFADDGTYRTEGHAYMSAEVGKKAVDFLIANSGKRQNLEIDFFGGEPLLNLGVVKEIVAYARAAESESGKKFHFTMTTNCVLLNEETARWLNEEMENVVLSIDGRKSVHDGVRKSANGKDLYDLILKNALHFRSIRGDKSYYVRGTFTALNPDFCADVLALADAGFDQISMEPVVTDIPDLAIGEEHLPVLFEQYDALAEAYLQRRKEGRFFNFFHFMLDLEGGPCVLKRLTGCGSGCEYLSVTPDGSVYPCHQFAERPQWRLGDVFEGKLDEAIRDIFARNVVTNRAACADCPAKYYCSGGCAANNLNFAGAMDKPYEIGCKLTKKRLENALTIAAVEACEA